MAASARQSDRRRNRMDTPSVESLSELEHGQREDGGSENHERNKARPQVLEAHALEDDAADDLEEVRQGNDGCQILGRLRHPLDREQEAREIDGRQEGQKRQL